MSLFVVQNLFVSPTCPSRISGVEEMLLSEIGKTLLVKSDLQVFECQGKVEDLEI
jgi:hypothetical protein